MIQVFADSELIYDSRIDEYRLLGLSATTGINIGGTAEIVMPPGHPAISSFTSYKTIVEIFKDGILQFRGRALYPSDDFNNQRTIICEGERCFLNDVIIRPYLYQDNPANIFANIITIYNAQVESFKQFVIGTVTVTDDNDYIRIESESAEQVSNVIDKLVERCGGYIVFTTNQDGQRVINWLAELNYKSNQIIEFGENLIDFARTDTNTNIATVIIPYGAKNEESGLRVDITSENNGLDYIQDNEAVSLRGRIVRAVYWDDVTQPINLLHKAQSYLASSKLIITSLTLTALDLSLLDKDIDEFRVGDSVQIRSTPHHIDEIFQLMERTQNFLDASQDHVTFGKEVSTLTGSDVSGDKKNVTELHRIEQDIKSDFTSGIATQIAEVKRTLSSLIEQTSNSIQLEVSEKYAKNDEVKKLLSTSLTQLKDSFVFMFNSLQAVVDENDAEAREQFLHISKHIRFENGDIILGESGNEISLRIENDRISFIESGVEVAYFSDRQLVILDGRFLRSLRIGNFALIHRANRNLSLVKVGD